MFTLTSRCVVDVLRAFGSASSLNRTNRRRGRREMLDICKDDDATTTTQTQTHTQTRYNTKQCKNRREALMALAFLSSSSLFSSPFSVFLSSSYAFEEEIGKGGSISTTEHRYQRRVQRDFAMGRPSGFLEKNFRNSISRCFIEIIVRCHR